MKKGQEMFVPANPDLADILDDTDFDFKIFPPRKSMQRSFTRPWAHTENHDQNADTLMPKHAARGGGKRAKEETMGARETTEGAQLSSKHPQGSRQERAQGRPRRPC